MLLGCLSPCRVSLSLSVTLSLARCVALRSDVLRVTWSAIIRSINMTGKNGQQIMQAVMQKVKAHRKLLAAFATNAKLELSLLIVVQVSLDGP